MLKRFFPHIYIEHIYDLPVEKLKRKGIKGLIFDIDNTIAPFDKAHPDPALLEYIYYLRECGFVIGILSNNNKERVELFNEQIGALAIYKANKPSPYKLQQAMKRLNLTPKTTALIGDQVFTDVWCGRQAKVLCILTRPLCDRDQLVTKVKRGLEKQVLKVYFERLEK